MEISSGEKSPGKYFWQFCQISEIFSNRGILRKIPGKLFRNDNDKKHNLPAVNKVTYFYPEGISDTSGNFQETFWRIFCHTTHLVTTEFVRMLHDDDLKFYGCKHVFYFNKFGKVIFEKFPREKNLLENVSVNSTKFQKFFRQSIISDRSKPTGVLLVKILKLFRYWHHYK